MRRSALLICVTALLVCAYGLGNAVAAAPYAGAPAVVGADGAVLAIAANPADVNGALDTVVGGSTWEITGTVSTYVAGQTVDVAVYLNGALVTTQTVAITASTAGSSGVFVASFHLKGAGQLTIQATHALSATQELLVSDPVYIHLVRASLHPGEHGTAVRILQSELSRAHFVVGVRGVYDARTQRAVLAFRKMADMPRTMVANSAVFKGLAAGRGKFKVRYRKDGRHVEGDLTHQVLALIGSNGKVQRLYPISSGKPSTPTQTGNFVVWLREPGVNNDGMVDSSFFNRGDAIHGYDPVPPYPASHGCLRVPIPDALSIYDWVGGTGVPVDVYYR